QVFVVFGDGHAAPDGDSAGQHRLALFTLEAEDVAFPVASHDDGTRFVLIALEEGTRVRPVSKARTGLTRGERAELRYALEAWIERLAEAVAEPSPAAGAALPSSGKAQLDADAVAWP